MMITDREKSFVNFKNIKGKPEGGPPQNKIGLNQLQ